MTTLFVMLLKDSLDEFAYDATIAGLHYQLKPLHNRISVSSQHLITLVEKVTVYFNQVTPETVFTQLQGLILILYFTA